MKKPSWKYAPEWAQWLAQDFDGEWWWWGDKPMPLNYSQFWVAAFGKSSIAGKGSPSLKWKETLEARP